MDKRNLFNYKCDYSAYVLRVELKSLGRKLRKEELLDDEVKCIKESMSDIRSTLNDLKWKYGVSNKVS